MLATDAAAATMVRAAKHPRLNLEASGITLARGAPLTAFSSNFELLMYKRGPRTQVNCSSSTLSGTIGLNGSRTFDTAEITEAAFKGGDPTNENLCRSTGRSFTIEATFTGASFTHTGVVVLKHPWFALRPTTGKENRCRLHKETITGTFHVNEGESREAMVVTFKNQVLFLAANSGRECSGGTLSATFSLSSSGSAIAAVLEPSS